MKTRVRRASGAFTLIEAVIAAAIVGIVFGGVINCYIQSGVRLEWTGYSLAAQSLASEVLEQARSGSWDPAQATPINNLTNMNLLAANYDSSSHTYTGFSIGILDVPYSGTNFISATNFVTVQLVYVNGDSRVQMQHIQVNTVWPFYYRKGNLYYTNTVSTMVAPDDRQI
ncbi:MAG TPA: prepilin-type N-terminal cleavage/methylation domain-containing protein [Verrucomicrobiae bacterium]|nr:prepilin-type N-terminal cleavage/methylation domain-containing protein [Verrucomicrobiae bacterium]